MSRKLPKWNLKFIRSLGNTQRGFQRENLEQAGILLKRTLQEQYPAVWKNRNKTWKMSDREYRTLREK